MDTGNFEVIEAHTYIADLDKSQSWDKELVREETKTNNGTYIHVTFCRIGISNIQPRRHMDMHRI